MYRHATVNAPSANRISRILTVHRTLPELSDLSRFHHRFDMVFDQPLEFTRNPGSNGGHPLFVNDMNPVHWHQTLQNCV